MAAETAEVYVNTPAGLRARFRAAFPFMLAAALFALGLYALYHLLAPVNLANVTAQIRATPWSTMALALLATLCGYLALTGYDWSALRYIGKPLPVPLVLIGGLLAYAFGNTIGFLPGKRAFDRWIFAVVAEYLVDVDQTGHRGCPMQTPGAMAGLS